MSNDPTHQSTASPAPAPASSGTAHLRRDGGAWVLRGLAAAGVLMSAVVHLELYLNQGFRDIDVIGPMFLLNAVAGVALGLVVLVWRSMWPLLGVAAFAAATLAAFYLSTLPGGFFGVHEPLWGAAQNLAAAGEWLALVTAVAAIYVEIRRAKTTESTPTHSS